MGVLRNGYTASNGGSYATENCEKGVLRAAHTCTSFSGEQPPPVPNRLCFCVVVTRSSWIPTKYKLYQNDWDSFVKRVWTDKDSHRQHKTHLKCEMLQIGNATNDWTKSWFFFLLTLHRRNQWSCFQKRKKKPLSCNSETSETSEISSSHWWHF